MSQLVPKLSGSSLASWLRGFGRLWDVGPSELHFYYLHHHLKKYLINSLNLQQTQLSENHMNTAIELNFYRPIASHDSENWKMLLDLLRSFTQKLREQHQILLCLEFMGLMAATNNTAAPASVLYLKLHLLDLRVEGECHLTTVLHAEEVCEALTAFIEANPAQSESSRRRITRGDEKQDSSVSPLSVAIEEGKQFARGLQLVPLHLHLQIISGKFGDIQYCADYLMEEILPSLQHSSEQKKSMVDGILFSHHALFRLVHSLVDSSETLDSVAVDSWTTILIDYSLGVLTRSEIWKMLLVGAAKKSEIKSSQTRTPESNFRRLTGLYILGKEVLCIPSLVVLSQKILNLILKVRYVSKKENVSLLVDSKQSIVPRAEELAHFLSTDYSSDLLYGNQVSEEVVPYLSAILCCNHIIGDLSVSERYFSAFAENESSLNSLLQQYQLMVKVLEARVVLLDTCCALSRDMQEMIIEFLQNQNSNVFCPFYDSESSDNFHAISFVGKELTLALSNLLTDLILMMTNFIDLYPEKVTLAVQKITNLCRIWSLKSSMSVEKLLCRNCDFLIFAAIDMYDVSDEPIERSLICLSVFEPLLELLLLLQLKGYPANLLDFAINELSMLRRHSREESGMAASIKGDILRCFSQLEGIWKASPASSLTTIETAEVSDTIYIISNV